MFKPKLSLQKHKTIINIFMEENENGLFVEPNAYIQHYECKSEGIKKVVFSEPYESLPNFHLNNDFIKHDCECLPKPKPKPCCKPSFDFSKYLPLLPMLFGGNKDLDVSKIMSCLGDFKGGGDILSSFISNPALLSGITSLFKPKTKQKKTEMKSTDFEIKNYTRVD